MEETVGVPSSLSSQTMDLPPLLTQHAAPLKILLVEPSRTQSGIVRRYLQAQDIQQVVAVTSGQEALQAARGDCPDAIISALHLADMDGVQLALQIRAEKETDAPGFVLISSEPDRAKTETLSACGQAILLHKPFTQEELITALSIVTGRPLLTNPEGAAITGLAPAASPASQPAPSVAPSRERLRVLLVDDSTAARLYQRNVLQGLGFVQFVEAANGAQAVAAIAQASDPGHFDLIVTDYNMPHMDGCGLVGYLKETPATASVPILLVTTETDPEKLEAVRHLGVAAVCDKTFSPEVVRGIVDQLFAE